MQSLRKEKRHSLLDEHLLDALIIIILGGVNLVS
jgi:hypothetical protein